MHTRSLRNRDVQPGVPNLHPTKFAAAKPNSGSDVSLGRTISVGAVDEWLAVNELELPADAVRALADQLTRTPNINAVTRMNAFQAVFEEFHGYSYADGVNRDSALDILRAGGHGDLAESLENMLAARAVSGPPAIRLAPSPDGTAENPYPASSPEVQSGAVVDTLVAENGTVFHRSRYDCGPNEPSAVRIQANRPLTAAEVEQMGGLVGYALMSTVGGEPADDPEQDSPYSFVMRKNTSKGRGSLNRFEGSLNDVIINGSHLRTTNRQGAGTAGTRVVDGIGDDTLEFEIYYDDVHHELIY